MNRLQKIDQYIKTKARIKITALIIVTMVAGYFFGIMSGKKGHNNNEKTIDSTAAEPKKTILWTCSMHPQIKLPKSGKCPICFMDLIPLQTDFDNASDSGNERRLLISDAAKRLASIVSVQAVRRNGSSQIKLLGKIAVDESRIESISMRIAGRIDKLFVDFTGKIVRKGDQLASIYSPELISVQQELISALQAVNNLSPDVAEFVKNNALGLLNASKDKLRLLGFSEYDLKQIIARGITSDHMIIRSSQSGVVLEKMAVTGNYAEPGMILFKIADLSKVWIYLDAYENDLKWIHEGQKMSFTVEAFPGEIFNGRVSFIDPVVNPVSRTVKVRVESANTKGRLKPEMFVKATLTYSVSGKEGDSARKSPGPVMIPATAPLLTGERAIVYMEVSSDSAGTMYEGREIVLGPKVGDYYIVESGIEEGERVVVNGAFRIDSELQIRARPSMMNPQGEVAATGHLGHREKHSMQESELSSKNIVLPIFQVENDTAEIMTNSSIGLSEKNSSFKSDLEKIYSNHMIVSRLLTEDKFEEAKKNMGNLGIMIKNIKTGMDGRNSLFKQSAEKISIALKHIDHIVNISDLRLIFVKISIQIINLEKQYGHNGGERYIAFCPMAFNNKGAYWLQTEKQIANPYFGSSMLRCGEIKETVGTGGIVTGK